MRKKDELKTERKTVLMTRALMVDIEQEAKKRGIKANAVMVERLSHSTSRLTPQIMVQIQNLANHACEAVREYSPKDAEKIQLEADELWTFLK